ncbi:MAG: methyltransferase domain-containing protein [Planctomyces sp.]|nr:methyltransferase domain-containing protein [Planctomyces sp.]
MSNSTLSAPPDPNAALERVDQAYSDPAWWYNLRGLGILTFAYRTTVWSQVAFLDRNISPNHLEIPVGTGTLLGMILRWRRLRGRKNGRIVAVDYSETMVAAAAKAFAKWPEVTVQRGDVANMPFGDDEFDSINVANGFHCFPDPDGALRELWRVTAHGGRVATNVLLYPRGIWPLKPIARAIDEWGKRKGLLVEPFHADDILARFRNVGFRIIGEEIRGNTINILAEKPRP